MDTKSQIAQNLPQSGVLAHCVSEADGFEYMSHILPSGTHITFPGIPDPAGQPQFVGQLRGGITFQLPLRQESVSLLNATGKCRKHTSRVYVVQTNRILVFPQLPDRPEDTFQTFLQCNTAVLYCVLSKLSCTPKIWWCNCFFDKILVQPQSTARQVQIRSYILCTFSPRQR